MTKATSTFTNLDVRLLLSYLFCKRRLTLVNTSHVVPCKAMRKFEGAQIRNKRKIELLDEVSLKIGDNRGSSHGVDGMDEPFAINCVAQSTKVPSGTPTIYAQNKKNG
jgi:hypothetical protein